MNLDQLLRDLGPAPTREALERVRARARAELKTGTPVARWPVQLARAAAAVLGVAAAAGLALFFTGDAPVALLLARLPTLGLLAVSSLLAAHGAVRGRSSRLPALAAIAAAAAAIVLARGAGLPSPSPGWVCTMSHLATGALPVVVVVAQLRGSAFDPWRAVLGGLAAGCTGAMLGELACGQGAEHVAAFHLPAWALVTLATWFVARRLKPRSFAP